jgi:alanyl-tRNA synthetase
MKAMRTDEIRRAFLDFFAERGHREVRSHALIPPNDPTLYFVNAGMVPFKDIFVGARSVDYARATSAQKCLRVSGKHNDLENVGRTARHHTFFEMLGNFSFGDYFKEDAIGYGWEFVTSVLNLPVDKLYVTVHPEDAEARDMWTTKTSIDPSRILDDPENFWSMGDTGPCGPCSEIHIDLGPGQSGGKELPFGHKDAEDRYIEIWNLVFMQFDRDADGKMTPLPKPSIDTGAGLERLAMVLQGTDTNYDTDAFLPGIEKMAAMAGITYGQDSEIDVALRVIADHSRSAAFLIADGIYPDNDGRGYVLRRIMRRAIRFGRLMGVTEPFLVHTTAHVVETMAAHYPELSAGADTIHRIVLQEETRFGRTITNGMKRLEDEVATVLAGDTTVLEGRIAFELYDTYGFPLDLTRLICEERAVTVDQPGFDTAMQEQRERARAASKFAIGDTAIYQDLVERGLKTNFEGYETATGSGRLIALLSGGAEVGHAAAGARVELVVDKTPFYAEGGGQVGDIGLIVCEDGTRVRVEDVQKPFGDLIVHFGHVEEGTLTGDQNVELSVDDGARTHTRRNHSATHLLHHALRAVLGEHVRQRGSLVAPDRLRFDFSHNEGMSEGEKLAVEQMVNEMILENSAAKASVLPMDDALAAGAIAFFEEKYGDDVRMMKIGEKSTELCGGLHVHATGDIGLFKIISEGAISSGVRRLEAVTGLNALAWVQANAASLRSAAATLRVGTEQVLPRLEKLMDERKELANELQKAKAQARVAQASASLAQARVYGDFKAAAIRLDGVPGKEMRSLAESLRDKLGGSGTVLITGSTGGKVSLIVISTKDVGDKLHAGKLVGELAPLVGGRGGGKPDMAQAGGSDVAGLDGVVTRFYERTDEAFGG